VDAHDRVHRGETIADISPVESADRALLVLQTLARAGSRGRSLAELSAALGLHKTTVHRALAARWLPPLDGGVL